MCARGCSRPKGRSFKPTGGKLPSLGKKERLVLFYAMGARARRWTNELDPSISKEKWTAAEDAVIRQSVAQLGTKWSQIAKHGMLKGRTAVLGSEFIRAYTRRTDVRPSMPPLPDELSLHRIPNRHAQPRKSLQGRPRVSPSPASTCITIIIKNIKRSVLTTVDGRAHSRPRQALPRTTTG